MGNTFWTVFKADLLFSICSIVFSVLLMAGIAAWKKKKKMQASPIKKLEGPRIVVLGGNEVKPAHCPLCGRDWPLPGPEMGEKKDG